MSIMTIPLTSKDLPVLASIVFIVLTAKLPDREPNYMRYKFLPILQVPPPTALQRVDWKLGRVLYAAKKSACT